MYHKSEKYEKGFSNVGCVISGELECTVYATDVSFNLFLFCFVLFFQFNTPVFTTSSKETMA